MATFGPASIVVIPFPFSDLSGSKLQPAVILAATDREIGYHAKSPVEPCLTSLL